MPLVTLNEIMNPAKSNRYAVGMFNVLNLEMIRGVVAAAEVANSPAILAVAEVHLPFGSMEELAPAVIRAAEAATVPIAFHFDHGMSPDRIKRALEVGFTSVMYDGSSLPYEENVENTRKTVELAAKYGASVEAELGHVGGAEGGGDHENFSQLTDPAQARDFVERTGIDALAVSIGTVHGVYRRLPQLDLERLRTIRDSVDVPLVLHGGSGLSDDDFRGCIAGGIHKINVCTDLFLAAVRAMRIQPEGTAYPHILQATEIAIREAALEKISVFRTVQAQAHS